jgi:hypothetical protein
MKKTQLKGVGPIHRTGYGPVKSPTSPVLDELNRQIVLRSTTPIVWLEPFDGDDSVDKTKFTSKSPELTRSNAPKITHRGIHERSFLYHPPVPGSAEQVGIKVFNMNSLNKLDGNPIGILTYPQMSVIFEKRLLRFNDCVPTMYVLLDNILFGKGFQNHVERERIIFSVIAYLCVIWGVSSFSNVNSGTYASDTSWFASSERSTAQQDDAQTMLNDIYKKLLAFGDLAEFCIPGAGRAACNRDDNGNSFQFDRVTLKVPDQYTTAVPAFNDIFFPEVDSKAVSAHTVQVKFIGPFGQFLQLMCRPAFETLSHIDHYLTCLPSSERSNKGHATLNYPGGMLLVFVVGMGYLDALLVDVLNIYKMSCCYYFFCRQALCIYTVSDAFLGLPKYTTTKNVVSEKGEPPPTKLISSLFLSANKERFDEQMRRVSGLKHIDNRVIYAFARRYMLIGKTLLTAIADFIKEKSKDPNYQSIYEICDATFDPNLRLLAIGTKTAGPTRTSAGGGHAHKLAAFVVSARFVATLFQDRRCKQFSDLLQAQEEIDNFCMNLIGINQGDMVAGFEQFFQPQTTKTSSIIMEEIKKIESGSSVARLVQFPLTKFQHLASSHLGPGPYGVGQAAHDDEYKGVGPFPTLIAIQQDYARRETIGNSTNPVFKHDSPAYFLAKIISYETTLLLGPVRNGPGGELRNRDGMVELHEAKGLYEYYKMMKYITETTLEDGRTEFYTKDLGFVGVEYTYTHTDTKAPCLKTVFPSANLLDSYVNPALTVYIDDPNYKGNKNAYYLNIAYMINSTLMLLEERRGYIGLAFFLVSIIDIKPGTDTPKYSKVVEKAYEHGLASAAAKAAAQSALAVESNSIAKDFSIRTACSSAAGNGGLGVPAAPPFGAVPASPAFSPAYASAAFGPSPGTGGRGVQQALVMGGGPPPIGIGALRGVPPGPAAAYPPGPAYSSSSSFSSSDASVGSGDGGYSYPSPGLVPAPSGSGGEPEIFDSRNLVGKTHDEQIDYISEFCGNILRDKYLTGFFNGSSTDLTRGLVANLINGKTKIKINNINQSFIFFQTYKNFDDFISSEDPYQYIQDANLGTGKDVLLKKVLTREVIDCIIPVIKAYYQTYHPRAPAASMPASAPPRAPMNVASASMPAPPRAPMNAVPSASAARARALWHRVRNAQARKNIAKANTPQSTGVARKIDNRLNSEPNNNLPTKISKKPGGKRRVIEESESDSE